jgi:hypothetical protein
MVMEYGVADPTVFKNRDVAEKNILILVEGKKI